MKLSGKDIATFFFEQVKDHPELYCCLNCLRKKSGNEKLVKQQAKAGYTNLQTRITCCCGKKFEEKFFDHMGSHSITKIQLKKRPVPEIIWRVLDSFLGASDKEKTMFAYMVWTVMNNKPLIACENPFTRDFSKYGIFCSKTLSKNILNTSMLAMTKIREELARTPPPCVGCI